MTEQFTSIEVAFLFGLVVAVLGDFIWARLLWVQWRHQHEERRKYTLLLYLTGFIASLALTSSSIGALNGQFHWGLPAEVLTFISSMGRGAILMTGIILLVRPRKERA